MHESFPEQDAGAEKIRSVIVFDAKKLLVTLLLPSFILCGDDHDGIARNPLTSLAKAAKGIR